MTVAWPFEKRENAQVILDEWLAHQHARAPREVAQLLGIIWHGAFLCIAGNYMSICLQWVLSNCVAEACLPAKSRHGSRWCWSVYRIHIPTQVFHDLRLLRRSLDEPAAGHTWSRPMGLLVNQSTTCTVLSNASYGVIGGWSPDLRSLWRITRAELVACGFCMRDIDAAGEEKRDVVEMSVWIYNNNTQRLIMVNRYCHGGFNVAHIPWALTRGLVQPEMSVWI